MRGSPAGPGQLALEEKAKEEFLLGKEGPRGRWRRGILVAPEGLNFFPFDDLHMCPFVPNFTFTFVSDSEIWFCTILF